MNGTQMAGGLAGIFFGFLVFVSAPYAYDMKGASDQLDTYNDVWEQSKPQVQEAANADGSDDDLGTYNEDYSRIDGRDFEPARPVMQSFKIRTDETAPAGFDSADDLGTYDEDWQSSDARGDDAAPSGFDIVGLTTQREADEMEADVWGNWQVSEDGSLNTNLATSNKFSPLTQREVDEMEADVWGNWQDGLGKSVRYENTRIFGVDGNLIGAQELSTRTA